MSRTFTVLGRPQPQGSMKWLPAKRKGGKTFPVVVPTNQEAINTYRQAIHHAWDSQPLRLPEVTEDPMALVVTFTFARPKNHYLPKNSKRPEAELRRDAPVYVNKTPDTDKLVRAVGDALTGRAWKDDKQVVHIIASKQWGEYDHTVITVAPLPGNVAPDA